VLFLSIHVSLLAKLLPSWNEGAAKKAIIEFVQQSVESVAEKDRIAVFDQDGTLWVEKPLYIQAVFALDRVKTLAKEHPAWKEQNPFKAVLADDFKAIASFSKQDWQQIIMATHAGMTSDVYADLVKKWLSAAKHPRFGKPYTELVYKPMQEVMDYMRANGFRIYIVTGGGQEFVRTYSEAVYGVPVEHVIGSRIETKYEYQGSAPILMRLPKMSFINDGPGKPVAIDLFIGKRPYAAFGNSNGDKQMLEWTAGGDGKRLMMLLLHDDAQREYAYGPAAGLPNSSVGTFSEELLKEAAFRGWTVISMKKDWKEVFNFRDEKH
jgi:phosphoserine phosphatase